MVLLRLPVAAPASAAPNRRDRIVATVQLVELKNGETYNGHLVNCDNKMNINLREVICTSRVCPGRGSVTLLTAACSTSHLLFLRPPQDGETFWHIPECYIRGNNIKYLRIPDEVCKWLLGSFTLVRQSYHYFGGRSSIWYKRRFLRRVRKPSAAAAAAPASRPRPQHARKLVRATRDAIVHASHP
jgi:small nuclear ribonucleoprotein (snRNP)-like protein